MRPSWRRPQVEFSAWLAELDQIWKLLIRSVKVTSQGRQEKDSAAPNQTSERRDILLPNLQRKTSREQFFQLVNH
jgi:hypothetical protein